MMACQKEKMSNFFKVINAFPTLLCKHLLRHFQASGTIKWDYNTLQRVAFDTKVDNVLKGHAAMDRYISNSFKIMNAIRNLMFIYIVLLSTLKAALCIGRTKYALTRLSKTLHCALLL